MIEIIGIACAALIFGFVLGAYLVFRLKKVDGELYIDDSNDQKTIWNLQLLSEPEFISNKKFAVFRIRTIK